MKKYKWMLILSLINCQLSVISQSVPLGDLRAKWKYFSKYSSKQRELICENWGQFFKEDLMDVLNPSINTYPIKLDSYGSLYPRKEILLNIDEKGFTYYDYKEVNMFKFSMYEMALINAKKIRESSLKLPDTEGRLFYNELMNNLEKDEDQHKNYTTESIDSFYKKWDGYHLNYEMKQLKAQISEGGFTRVLFFIHGYNVPYSLAALQTIEAANIIDSLQKAGKVPPEKILYVPIFWPSNSQKECAIISANSFSTEDVKGLFNGGPNNGFRYLYFSNRAYYAAITLRAMLNELNGTNVKIGIYSHSLGCTVATTALINTYTKLQSDYVDFMNTYLPGNETNDSMLKELQKAEPITYDIFVRLANGTLPKQTIDVFLSAPAIPGEATFCDIKKNTRNIKYYCTLNTKDRMLTKSAIRVAGINVLKPYMFSSSTLGCDYQNEVERTKTIFKEKNGSSANFISSKPIEKIDHDIFTYMQQPEYINLIIRFLNSN